MDEQCRMSKTYFILAFVLGGLCALQCSAKTRQSKSDDAAFFSDRHDSGLRIRCKGSIMHFEQLLEDAANHIRVSITVWVSKNGARIDYNLMSLRNGQPGESHGHLYSKDPRRPLAPCSLKGFIPRSKARSAVEEFLSYLHRRTCQSNVTSMDNHASHSSCSTERPSPGVSSIYYPVKTYLSGSMMTYEQDFLLDVPSTSADAKGGAGPPTACASDGGGYTVRNYNYVGNKYSVKICLTEDKKYLSYSLMIDQDNASGLANGAFWGQDKIDILSFHGIIPQCDARLKVEQYLCY